MGLKECVTYIHTLYPHLLAISIQFCISINWQALFQVSWLPEEGDEIAVHNTEEGVHTGCDGATCILTEALCSIWQVYHPSVATISFFNSRANGTLYFKIDIFEKCVLT